MLSFFKQKAAYEVRISDWSSDVCSSDLLSFLKPVPSYPVISATWPAEDLSGLPAAPPLNLLALALRSKSLTRRDFTNADPDAGRAQIGSASCRERVCQYV